VIDWYFVFTNSLWILGLSVVLAAFSYHHWLAGETGRRLREQFREPGWVMPFSAGMCLVGLGLGLSQSARWWERIAWLMLAGTFVWDGMARGYLKRPSTGRVDASGAGAKDRREDTDVHDSATGNDRNV
jgi:sulfite exporter TauE/SafE